jgi:CBS domain-containing protein
MPNLDSPQATAGLALPVKRLLKKPPLFVDPAATVQQAAAAMQNARVGSVLITTDPPGIVSDRDLRGRVLAASLGPQTAITQVMSRPLKTIDADAPAFTALRLMLEHNIHHLPVIEEGKIVGVISSTDLLFQQSSNPLYLRQTLETLSEPLETARYSEKIGSTVDMLFESGLGAAQIGQLISSLNDVLVKRLVDLAQAELGTPPTAYAWIVFGSEGRLEQALLTDQDNALVFDDSTGTAQNYFDQLSRLVVDGLIQAGFPRCPGEFMATRWCKPLNEWHRLFTNWIRLPEPKALLDAAIFFDFRPIAGELSLESLEQLITGAQNEKRFLAHMLNGALAFRPSLGLFNRLRSDNGNVDLKKGGIASIVSLARVAALAAGSRERPTLERLRSTAASGSVLSPESAQEFADIFPVLLRLRLRAQLAARKKGQRLENSVNLTELSTLEKRHLRESLIIIKDTQEELRAAWQLDRLG